MVVELYKLRHKKSLHWLLGAAAARDLDGPKCYKMYI